jgi:hypothetical protein
MAIVSRLQLDHPALNTAGGSGLHTSIENLYIRIGNNMNSRFFEIENLVDAASIDLEHNFKTSFSTLKYDLYLWDTGTDELTLVSDAGLDDYAIIPTPGDETTHIRVTNNSGSTQDLVLVVTHQVIDSKKVDCVIRNINSNSTLLEGRYHLIDTNTALTLTLPDPTETKRPIWIKDKTGLASVNPITLARFDSEEIETIAASFDLDSDLGAWTLVSDGSNWFIL